MGVLLKSMRVDHEAFIGRRFGRWVVTEVLYRYEPKRKAYYSCTCDCGSVVIVSKSNLLSGTSRSCGCLKREVTSARSKTHGMSGTSEYWSWNDMHRRCYEVTRKQYKHYGGRGITVCERWHSFDNFLADMGLRPARGYSIERIDNNGPYSPENCRWATQKEQCRNQRRTVMLTARGVTRPMQEWADILGLKVNTIRHRMRVGWDIDSVLFIPAHSPEAREQKRA